MTAMTDADGNSWRDYHKRVRPLPPEIAVRVAQEIADHDQRVLLLGVTRSYAELGRQLTAVDWCQEQIANVWIGDSPSRRALLADWREMDLPRGHFTAVTGDGSFSTLVWPNDYRLTLDRVADALVPGGRLVVRCYIAPDEPESLAQIADDVLARRAASFYSARWRIAMALAAGGNVAVPAIRQAFDLAFPDRSALSLATGWDRETIDEIDAYLDSDLVYSFLTRTQIVETLTDRFTDSRFVSSGNYPMAEHYPLLVADRRG